MMKEVKIIIILLAVLVLSNSPVTGQSNTSVALEGLDPVLLVQGREVLGKTSHTVVRERFQYFFSTEETKQQFLKSPEKYEIQLGGSCARMGPQVGGNADLFTVHDGRIYIFGSSDCKELFEGAPEKYLAPTVPDKLKVGDDAVKRGRQLIAQIVEATGGAARIDAIKNYQVSTATDSVMRLLPDHYRVERQRSYGTSIDVITPADGFQTFIRGDQKNMRDLPEAYRRDLATQLKRSLLEMLIARTQPGFSAAAAGKARAGDREVVLLEVLYNGVHMKLGVDAGTGRVHTMTFIGRNSSNGEVGEVVQNLSDYRTVNGLTLPFKIESNMNDSISIEKIIINGEVDETVFKKP